MSADYEASFKDFLHHNSDYILGKLSKGNAYKGFATESDLLESWIHIIKALKNSISEIIQENSTAEKWHLFLEYPLIRLEKQIDAVILAEDIIIVIEFKENDKFSPASQRQVEDYALSLRDFHQESLKRTIIPVLCCLYAAEEGSPYRQNTDSEEIAPISLCNRLNLSNKCLENYYKYHNNDLAIDPYEWNHADYSPVPTIIDAARLLYSKHNIRELNMYSTSKKNLSETTNRLEEIIKEAKNNNKKVICFVTGVPGSGKTLVGLNAVHDPDFEISGDKVSTFLSGNRPLVEILREALIRDKKSRDKCPRHIAENEVKAKIQHIIFFLKEYVGSDKSKVPKDHVVIFDEAQRAWDLKQSNKKFKRGASEPELFIQIMDKHNDSWAVIIALVGGGQEIHDGEAGLSEWGVSILKHNKWEVYISPEIAEGGPSIAGSKLFQNDIPPEVTVHLDRALHLSVPQRTFRNENVAAWVNSCLNGNPQEATQLLKDNINYPIYLTRSLEQMREWLKQRMTGFRRLGLLASSGAKRLRAYGLYTLDKDELDETKHWFLNPQEDIRSSNKLEVAVSEFACQGLELDYVGLSWGGDLTRNLSDNCWRFRRLRGAGWQNIGANNINAQDFLLNKYRVLLTRAREGFVIWIPQGSIEDPTRKPEFYDQTAEYLIQCGIPLID